MTQGRGEDANPRDGDRIAWTLILVEGEIRVDHLEVRGCAVARQAAEAVARLVAGRTPSEARALGVPDVVSELGTVDPEYGRCVLTAIAALRAALNSLHVAELEEAAANRRPFDA